MGWIRLSSIRPIVYLFGRRSPRADAPRFLAACDLPIHQSQLSLASESSLTFNSETPTMKAFVIHPEDAEPPSDDREYQSAWDSTNTEKVTDLTTAETLGAPHILDDKPLSTQNWRHDTVLVSSHSSANCQGFRILSPGDAAHGRR
jgi:hypothetical protein